MAVVERVNVIRKFCYVLVLKLVGSITVLLNNCLIRPVNVRTGGGATYRVIFGSCKIVGAQILTALKENMHFKPLHLIHTSNTPSRGITPDKMLKNE